ncbi:MAG TPA: energy transducer TonB [candidate division Zixibacteria bacterium]|nr:energy transducer TonB [candidate division Zixibacteria bacterium]MDD4918220.1 energy transducer TonB [candidate division Zixibacteria bacterium]MDM7971600.1 energy transducer TonB [candidate division Zixibacteria bacterium]HOD66443.1 energy transducer TonB [candidate division Zixibacteria bacterium]HOZ07978.1 energy transducer TonB [candidate division Zixibacteria bacterium]
MTALRIILLVTLAVLPAGCVRDFFPGRVDRESFSFYAGPCDTPPAPADSAFDTRLQPQVIRRPADAYPPLPPWAATAGSVRLRVLVGCDGRVIESVVSTSSGSPILDAAAREGVALCRFAPAVENNRPVASWIRVRYDFLPPRADGARLRR